MIADQAINGAPIIVRAGKPAVVLQPALEGIDEKWLQRLIHENPTCLPLAEIEPSLGVFFSICREVPTKSGYIDNLLMSGSGDIALVETKLFKNPEARRQAVAQILDYATAIFAMGYSQFEKNVLSGSFSPSEKPKSLYEALPEADKRPEAEFIDAVSDNLRNGRAVLLIAGNGIRREAENLLEGMNAHARFGFTFALVELGVFRMPDNEGYLVRPRTLAKTAIVQRTIVEVVGADVSVKEEHPPVPESLSSTQYWDALEKSTPGARAALEALIVAAEPLGIYPDFLATLNLKWDRPGAKPVNLGYIQKHGGIWIDASYWFAPPDLAEAYAQDLAKIFGGEVKTFSKGGGRSIYLHDRPLRIRDILNRAGDWLPAMQRFIAAISMHDASSEATE
jgi:hypothetical protein